MLATVEVVFMEPENWPQKGAHVSFLEVPQEANESEGVAMGKGRKSGPELFSSMRPTLSGS